MVATRRTVHRGDLLFRSGDAFESLYAVRTGFFKTRVTSEDGRDQVTGFQMAGELLGLDGIGSDRHTCDAVALEDSQVCVIPYGQLESLSREFTDLQRQFHKIMSREIVRDHGVMLLLGSMRAEERLAAFLLNLAQRLQARGFSPSSLVLRMTPRGDRHLPGPEARDRQPLLLEVPGRRHPAGQAAPDPGAGPGGAADDRWWCRLLRRATHRSQAAARKAPGVWPAPMARDAVTCSIITFQSAGEPHECLMSIDTPL